MTMHRIFLVQRWLGMAAVLWATSVCTGADVPASDQPSLRGDVKDLIGETPEAPPSGYPNRRDLLAAVAQGKESVVALYQTFPDVDVKRNIVYTKNGGIPVKLDLYRPRQRKQPVPGLIFIHGGGWAAGKKEDYSYYGQVFANKGYIVASINYRLTSEAAFPAAVEDCKCAVRWMRAHAARLGVDPDRIGVAGGSAGGHLSLMVAYSSDEPKLEGNGEHQGVGSHVRCVVSLYGPTDLTTEFARTNEIAAPIVKRFLGGTFDEKRDLYRQASPINYVSDGDPATLVLHGTVDEIVPINQSDLLVAKLKQTGIPYVYDRLEGWPHGMDLANRVNQRCVWLMDRFFHKCLRSEEARPKETE